MNSANSNTPTPSVLAQAAKASFRPDEHLRFFVVQSRPEASAREQAGERDAWIVTENGERLPAPKELNPEAYPTVEAMLSEADYVSFPRTLTDTLTGETVVVLDEEQAQRYALKWRPYGFLGNPVPTWGGHQWKIYRELLGDGHSASTLGLPTIDAYEPVVLE